MREHVRQWPVVAEQQHRLTCRSQLARFLNGNECFSGARAACDDRTLAPAEDAQHTRLSLGQSNEFRFCVGQFSAQERAHVHRPAEDFFDQFNAAPTEILFLAGPPESTGLRYPSLQLGEVGLTANELARPAWMHQRTDVMQVGKEHRMAADDALTWPAAPFGVALDLVQNRVLLRLGLSERVLDWVYRSRTIRG